MTQSPVGARFDHYRVVEFLGWSCAVLGEVYRAQDEELERDVILVVLGPQILDGEAARRHFDQAAGALLRLQHPNVSTLLDFGTAGDADYLVWEDLPENTLPGRLEEGAFPEAEVVRAGVQLAEGLASIHAAGLVYRDLQPRNLLLRSDGQLKILRAGMDNLLRSVGGSDRKPDAGSHLGFAPSPYVTPEQLLWGRVDARSNIYSAGAVLYEMATGQRPFPGAEGPVLCDAIVHRTLTPPREIQTGLSRALDGLLQKALAKDPDLRHQSAHQLKCGLERLAARDS